MKKNLLFSALSVFVFFLSVEISLRFIQSIDEDKVKIEFNKNGNPLFKSIPDNYLGYKMNPESSVPGILEINSFGYRGREITLKKPANTYRIITLGGSSTAGYQVWPGFAYPDILEHLLKNNPPSANLNYEVLNGGVGGYTSIQAQRSLVRDLIKFDPDLVVWMSGWNDIQQSFNDRWYPDILLQKKSRLTKFATYEILKQFFGRLLTVSGAKAQYKTFNEEALLYYKKNTENTITFLKEKGIDIWLLSLPIAYAPDDPANGNAFQIAFGDKKSTSAEVEMTLLTYKRYLNVMKELSSRYNIPLVNSGLSENVSGKRYFFTDILHPNNSGNKVIAYNLYKQFVYKNNFYNIANRSVFNDFWEAELLYGNISNTKKHDDYLSNLGVQLKGTFFNNKKSVNAIICEFVINLIKAGGLEDPYIQKHLLVLLKMGMEALPEYPLTYFIYGKIMKEMLNAREADKFFSKMSLHDKRFDIKKALNADVQANKSWRIDQKKFFVLLESIHPNLKMEIFHNILSRLFGTFGEYDLGIDYARKALSDNPQLVAAKWNLILNLYLSGEMKEALHHAEKLYENPERPKQLIKLLKEIYLKKGLTEKAKKLTAGDF